MPRKAVKPASNDFSSDYKLCLFLKYLSLDVRQSKNSLKGDECLSPFPWKLFIQLFAQSKEVAHLENEICRVVVATRILQTKTKGTNLISECAETFQAFQASSVMQFAEWKFVFKKLNSSRLIKPSLTFLFPSKDFNISCVEALRNKYSRNKISLHQDQQTCNQI